MDVKFDDSGLKKLRKKLREMKDLEHGKNVPIEELLNPKFMKRYTKSRDFEEFILESGLINSEKPITKEVFEAIPNEDWDEYISKHTSFSSWHDMLEKAGEEYLANRLFRGLK